MCFRLKFISLSPLFHSYSVIFFRVNAKLSEGHLCCSLVGELCPCLGLLPTRASARGLVCHTVHAAGTRARAGTQGGAEAGGCWAVPCVSQRGLFHVFLFWRMHPLSPEGGSLALIQSLCSQGSAVGLPSSCHPPLPATPWGHRVEPQAKSWGGLPFALLVPSHRFLLPPETPSALLTVYLLGSIGPL